MVSSLTIIFIIISAILSIIIPIAICIFFYKKYKISFKNVVVGALIFILFVTVLEASMHRFFLVTNTTTSIMLSNPWLFAIYGAFAAGIFEEVGRFIGYKFLLKGRRERKDALAYGIGHGGIEAILLGGIASIQNLAFALMINKGTLNAILGSKAPKGTIDQIQNSLINSSSYLFLISGVERVSALAIQIFLSLIVLYGIKEKKYIFLLYAILIHAAIDFPAALFQKGMFSSMLIMESMYAIIGVVCLVLIIKSPKYFKSEDENLLGEEK